MSEVIRILRHSTLVLLLAAFSALTTQPAAAQEESLEGRISGAVVSGTAGVELGDVTVRLVILEDSSVVGDEQASVLDGRFEFAVPATVGRTYIVAARYQEVQYIAAPVVLSPEQPEASVGLTLYETTDRSPELRIDQTVVTVVGIDRGRSELLLRREDTVFASGDRVFVGDAAGATLRLTAPTGTIEADGGELDGGTLLITTPLFPAEQNSIVTQYVVRYDAAIDRYSLQVDTPVPAERIDVRVPTEYVRRLDPRGMAQLGQDYAAPEFGGTVMKTAMVEAAFEGQGMRVDLVGLSNRLPPHPLTSQPGASIAAGLAVLLVGGGALVRFRSIRLPLLLRALRVGIVGLRGDRHIVSKNRDMNA